MILEFRVKNFKSFKDEVVFSMVANDNDDTNPDALVDFGKLKVLKTAVLYGPNASGKSNLVEAMALMSKMVVGSYNKEPGSPFGLSPFKFNEQSPMEPTLFEANLLIDGERFVYGFNATDKKVLEEWLYWFPNIGGKARTLFERSVDNPIKKGLYMKEKALFPSKPREDCLALTNAAHNNHEQSQSIYDWFRKKFHIVTAELHPNTTSIEFLADTEGSFKTFVNNMICRADFGINEVNCKKRKLDTSELKFPESMPEEVKKYILDDMAIETDFVHNINGQKFSLSMEQESDGTRKFYGLLRPTKDICELGHTSVFDEFDRSMHTHLSQYYVEFLQSKANKNGQLIMTLHDVELMDLLRRDQIWFTQKNAEGVSELYSLAEYKDIRKEEAKRRRYLAGHYEAIPYIQEFE